MSVPLKRIDPLSGDCNVAMVRIRDDLPAPFGPSNPNIPLFIPIDILLIERTPFGYVLLS
jgi:hypothetical protein